MNQCLNSDAELKETEIVPHASPVCSHMHAVVCIRSNIAFVVGIVDRHQINPGMTHWKIAKRINRYL